VPATYRILHASDLHISHIPYSLGPGVPNPHWTSQSNHRFLAGHDENVLEAFARFVYRYGFQNTTNDPNAGPGAKPPLFEHLFVTGDLAATGYPNDLERAYRFLTEFQAQTPQPWKNTSSKPEEPTIGFLRDRIDAMPGNHDRYLAGSLCSPGGTEFDTIFNDTARPRQFWVARQGAQKWQVLKKPGGRPLALLAADFTLASTDLGEIRYGGWFGQGRAYQKIVLDLEKATTDLVSDCQQWGRKVGDRTWEDPAILWVIHFDPTSTSRTLHLLDAGNLIQAATRLKIPALLGGHTHESLVRPLTLTTNALVAGTVCQGQALNRFDPAEAANDFQILRIEVPDRPAEPLAIDVTWYRYKEFPKSLQIPALAGPVGRFVPIATPLGIP
jgi:3',5'-cyclic AMP phosphodiesterase CpdA